MTIRNSIHSSDLLLIYLKLSSVSVLEGLCLLFCLTLRPNSIPSPTFIQSHGEHYVIYCSCPPLPMKMTIQLAFITEKHCLYSEPEIYIIYHSLLYSFNLVGTVLIVITSTTHHCSNFWGTMQERYALLIFATFEGIQVSWRQHGSNHVVPSWSLFLLSLVPGDGRFATWSFACFSQ